ncbi:MAG: hypothetical protein H0W86_01170 [Armatimonadetes bacterium]|nr:hypothetical protein [Armatimonadota bacterium]
MNLINGSVRAAVAAVLLVSFGTNARADILVYTFDEVISGDTPGGTPPWATLTIEDMGPNVVDLTLTHNVSSAEGQFLTELDLSLTSIPGDIVVSEPLDPLLEGQPVFGDNLFTNAGFQFDVRIEFVNAPPDARFFPGLSATIELMGTGLDSSSFTTATQEGEPTDLFALLHIQGIPPNDGSGKLGGNPVPEPSALATLICLLPLLALRRRR